ncbi:MAG TPA: hypothetical protein VFR37_07280 [Longimicrobium sp.]|nr:hypothetical protein [Longimicrobium sp.]
MPKIAYDNESTRPADGPAPEQEVGRRHGRDVTPPEVRLLQFLELERAAAQYGLDATPNEFPEEKAEPEPANVALRRHLAHLTLTGTVLDPLYRPPPLITEISAIDGVPLHVVVRERYTPLERCILCGGAKGETYTICAGCYTTQLRFAEQRMLAMHPGMEEGALAGLKPLSHDQFVRAIRRTPRLEPVRRARLDPAAESARRRLRHAAALAQRVAVLQELRDGAEAEGISDAMRERRWVRFIHAVEYGFPWHSRAWHAGLGAMSADPYWYALLSSADTGEESREDDDEYPLEWNDDDWMYAPDRVQFLHEEHGALVPRPNTAAGTEEHRAARNRNILIDAVREAESLAAFGDWESIAYAEWLRRELDAAGGMPSRLFARVPPERDADECDRWDRWVDSILGGEPAPVPENLDPREAEWCRYWALGATTDTSASPDSPATRRPVMLSTLDRGLPSGRIRWPHFVREEIEAELRPWGDWVEVRDDDTEDSPIAWCWCGEEPQRRRRLSPDAARAVITRRLGAWARGEAPPVKTAPGGRRPKGSRGAWERAIRNERRRRHFEAMANANAGIHPTRLESARHQAT